MSTREPASVRLAHLSATLRLHARCGRAPEAEELQAWSDVLQAVALELEPQAKAPPPVVHARATRTLQ